MTCDERGQSLALLPCCSHPRVGITKPNESSLEKIICGRSFPTGTLPVKGPAKNELRRTIMFGSHPREPMVDQRGLADTSPRNDANDIHPLVCPGSIQKSDILLSAKKTASGNRQSSY